jgi:hypothetical protein
MPTPNRQETKELAVIQAVIKRWRPLNSQSAALYKVAYNRCPFAMLRLEGEACQQ